MYVNLCMCVSMICKAVAWHCFIFLCCAECNVELLS